MKKALCMFKKKAFFRANCKRHYGQAPLRVWALSRAALFHYSLWMCTFKRPTAETRSLHAWRCTEIKLMLSAEWPRALVKKSLRPSAHNITFSFGPTARALCSLAESALDIVTAAGWLKYNTFYPRTWLAFNGVVLLLQTSPRRREELAIWR